jgi:hypothetical protein
MCRHNVHHVSTSADNPSYFNIYYISLQIKRQHMLTYTNKYPVKAVAPIASRPDPEHGFIHNERHSFYLCFATSNIYINSFLPSQLLSYLYVVPKTSLDDIDIYFDIPCRLKHTYPVY